MKKLLFSIKNAMNGITHVISKHNNFRIMSVIATIVIVVGILLRLNSIEWFFISWSIATVLIAEMVNTAVEHVINLIHKKRSIYAKLAKDVSAGAVLLSSIWAGLIGALIFIPKIIDFLRRFF